jgi:CBS domain containing-hemolysin-like protein
MLAIILQEALPPPLSFGQILLRVATALFLVATNGFFVAAEFALVSSRRSRIEELADAGDRRARLVRTALSDLNLYLSASQLGITLASLALGWVAESTVAAVLIQIFEGLPRPWSLIAAHTVASTIAFCTITFMHIVLGEQAPKTMAITNPELTALWTAPPLVFFSRVLRPFIIALNASSTYTLRLFRLKPVDEADRVHRPEEIEILIAQMYEHGRLAQEPVEMIRGVFDLSETSAAEVMTPRTQITAAPATVSAEALEDLFVDSGHSRLPVYEGSVDHIIGIVLARDFWRARRDRRQFNLTQLIRTVPFVPETKDIEHLLREMQREGTHIAIVLDEYGGTAGLVTVEDLLEQIVGEIADEHEVQREEIHVEADGRVLLAGRVLVADLNERFSLHLPEDEYTTVAGYMMGTLGRVAEEGDELPIDGGRLRVASMSGRRVELIEMVLDPKRAEEEDE